MNEEGKIHGPVSNTDGHDVVTDNPVHNPVSYTDGHDGAVDGLEDSHVGDGSVDAVDHVGGKIVSYTPSTGSVTPAGVSSDHPTHPGPTDPGTPTHGMPPAALSSLATPLVTRTATPMLESGTGSSSSSENVLACPVVTPTHGVPAPLVKRTATPMLESGRDQMHKNDIHQPAKRPRLRGKALNSKEGGKT